MTGREHDTIAQALRAWAKGIYPIEAGVELLIRTGLTGGPWVRCNTEARDRWWVDVDEINPNTIGTYSGGQRRLLRIAASLLGGEAANLYEDVPGLDRAHLALVLAAIAHAGGSHEHSGPPQPDPTGRFTINGVRSSWARLPSLCSWPAAGSRD